MSRSAGYGRYLPQSMKMRQNRILCLHVNFFTTTTMNQERPPDAADLQEPLLSPDHRQEEADEIPLPT